MAATRNGLSPLFHRDGGTVRAVRYEAGIDSGYASNLKAGDPLTFANGKWALATGTAAVVGVFQSVDFKDADGIFRGQPNWAAGTVATDIALFVYIDKGIVYEVAADGNVPATDRGKGANLSIGAGTAKRSGAFLLSASTATPGVAVRVVGASGDDTVRVVLPQNVDVA